MQQSITDKSSAPYQRLAWEALKKSINGLINKVNVSNIVSIVKELMAENIVRGRYASYLGDDDVQTVSENSYISYTYERTL